MYRPPASSHSRLPGRRGPFGERESTCVADRSVAVANVSLAEVTVSSQRVYGVTQSFGGGQRRLRRGIEPERDMRRCSQRRIGDALVLLRTRWRKSAALP